MRITGALLILALLAAACGSSKDDAGASATPRPDTSATNPAANLRAGLQDILGIHVVLASAATGALLRGRTSEFDGAAAALNGVNSEAVAEAFVDAYGGGVRSVVLALWRKHIRFIVDYAGGLKTKDKAKQDTALAALLAYTEEFGAEIERLTEKKLTKAGVAALVKEHVSTLRTVIDAQAAGKPLEVFPAFFKAHQHMGGMAKLLGATIAEQKGVAGDPASKAADLRANLGQILAQHIAFASFSTAAITGGRGAEASAAKDHLVDGNAEDLARVFGSSYGPDVEKSVLALWRAHLAMLEDYAAGLAAGDTARSAKAATDLTSYAKGFGTALNGVISGLPAAAVEKLVLEHIRTLKAVIDAQAAGNWTTAYTALDTAAHHMDEIASALATAIAVDKKL